MNISQPTVHSDEVHIWKYKMKKWNRGFLSLLSEEEKNRWLRFYQSGDAKRFAMAHAFLRLILQRYTGIEASQVELVKGNNERPELNAEIQERTKIYFNLSYRDDYALVAISNNRFTGVDIESVKDVGHISSFVKGHFSDEEKQQVLGLKNLYDRLAMLFTIWVMKEALIKANAKGFSESITRYNLCPFLYQPECIPDFDSDTWHIARFGVADNYKAACAVRSGNIIFKEFEYGLD